MPRDIPLGNGSLYIAYDKHGFIRELCYPYVGMENHTTGHPFKVGLMADGTFSWLDNPEWDISRTYEDLTMKALISYTSDKFKLSLTFQDVVDFHENLFMRKITLKNLSGKARKLRLFFHHDLHIYGTDVGDTACYKPEAEGLLHYKGRRYFLINAVKQNGTESAIAQYATGKKESHGFKGTWLDAEDGELSGNPISQGAVDSVAALHFDVPPNSQGTAWYWIAVGKSWSEVNNIRKRVIDRTPQEFIKRTANYWHLWLNKDNPSFGGLPRSIVDIYKKSLLVVRSNTSENGTIMAAIDSDILMFNRDTYAYIWPRDGAIVAHCLDLAGYPVPARKFFDFCGEVMGREGYFLHKYNPDGSLASSWHSWVSDNDKALPIQEDETGLVLWALWEHFNIYRDIEYLKPLYRRLIKSAADFMMEFRDPETGLPLPSYDLWEERFGVHTFTVCSVIAGLRAAANFTEAFGDTELADRYREGAELMLQAMKRHMYDKDNGGFVRSLNVDDSGKTTRDTVRDASISAIVTLGILPPVDPMVEQTMNSLHERLWCKTPIGGMARYEGDSYQAVGAPTPDVPGNPWIISTLWYVQYLIDKAGDKDELKEAVAILQWVTLKALPSGTFAEQIHPHTGEPLSVSPLTWSHAEFVITVKRYIKKIRSITRCPHCDKMLWEHDEPAPPIA